MNQETFQDLLNRYSEGTCTNEEKAVLESWVTFGDFYGNVLSDEQVEDRLTGLAKRLPLARKSYQLWPRIAVAASILMVLGAGVFFFNKHGRNGLYSESGANFLVANDIDPGKNTAKLTLSDGKTIVLSDAKNGIVVDEEDVFYSDGTAIGTSAKQDLAVGGVQTISTPRGGTYQVTLTDGTKVWLNAASSLTYPVDLNKGKTRKVKLEGEGYFEVAKNKARPFMVESSGQRVEVLGTHFNINNYHDEAITKTTLLEGMVRVSLLNAVNGVAKAVTLLPEQQSVLASDQISVTAANIENIMAWKNGDFVFAGEDFKTTMRKIARWYDVDIVYAAGSTENVNLGGWISRKSRLSTILRRIEQAGNVHFKIEGRKIIVEK